MHRTSSTFLVTLLAASISGPSSELQAAIHGTSLGLESPPLVGTRSTSDATQLSGGNRTIMWNITDNLNGTWHYQYMLTGSGSDGIRSISHIDFQISQGAFDNIVNELITVDVDLNSGTSILVDPPTLADDDQSISAPWILSGGIIKFDDGVEDVVEDYINDNFGPDSELDPDILKVTYEFDSDRIAVWGNLAIKSGQVDTYNVGAGLENTSMDANNFVAVPDSVIVPVDPEGMVPEATGFLTWIGLALSSSLFVRRR